MTQAKSKSEQKRLAELQAEEDEKNNQNNSEETITVSREKLTAILSRIDRLESAANKAGLAKYDSANKGDQGKVVKLLLLNGKVILRWDKMPKNIVEKDPKGYWREEQTVKITFEDKKQEEMPYVIFARRYDHIPAKVITETINRDKAEIEKMGDTTFNVETNDGKKYTIGSTFIN